MKKIISILLILATILALASNIVFATDETSVEETVAEEVVTEETRKRGTCTTSKGSYRG